MIYAYSRVSTALTQDLQNQEYAILKYAQENNLKIDKSIGEVISSRKKDRKVFQLVEDLRKGDTLIIYELSRLGRNIFENMDLAKQILEKDAQLIDVSRGLKVKNDMQGKIYLSVFSLIFELEREHISMRTKSALAQKKAKGIQLGRKKGCLSKSKLDDHKGEIIGLLEKQVSLASICKIYGCGRNTLYNFMETRKVDYQSYKK